MQVRALDSDAYYSCHATFTSDEASNTDQEGGHKDLLLKFRDHFDSSCDDEGSFKGDLYFCSTLLLSLGYTFWGEK